ncbi:MAG TPA: FeoA family protein [Planctomycetota bacterium]
MSRNKKGADQAGDGLHLDDLPRLGRARVVGVAGTGPEVTRLRELGFVAGTEVSFARFAPMGDPMCVRLRGAELCVRAREARRIRIEPLPGAGGDA